MHLVSGSYGLCSLVRARRLAPLDVQQSRFAQEVTLHALKLVMKVNQRRNKRRAADAIDDSSLCGSNVMYGLVDPHAEWIARPIVLQSEAMLEMQLVHSKDVLAQCMAVRALDELVAQVERGAEREAVSVSLRSEQRHVSLHGVYMVLLRTLRNKNIFCRCVCYFPRQRRGQHVPRAAHVLLVQQWLRVATTVADFGVQVGYCSLLSRRVLTDQQLLG